MIINWDTFHTAYKNASSEQKAVIDSDLISICVDHAVVSHQLDTSHYGDLVKLFQLFILNAIDEPTMVGEMRQLGVPDAQVIFSELQLCRQRTPVVPITYDDDTDIADEIAATEEALSATLGQRPSPLPSPIPLPPTPLPPPVPAPTETVYSSTQAAILQEQKKPATVIPAWENPRWESETKQ